MERSIVCSEFNLQVQLQLGIHSQMYLLFFITLVPPGGHVRNNRVTLSSNTQPANETFMNRLTGSVVTLRTSNQQSLLRSLINVTHFFG